MNLNTDFSNSFKILLPNVSFIIQEAEQQLMEEFHELDLEREMKKMCYNKSHATYQSSFCGFARVIESFIPKKEEKYSAFSVRTFKSHLIRCFNNSDFLTPIVGVVNDTNWQPIEFILKLVEDIYYFYTEAKHDYINFKNNPFKHRATIIFLKLRTGKSFTSMYVEELFNITAAMISCFQSDEDKCEDMNYNFMDFVNNYDMIKNSAVLKKFLKILSALLCFCVCEEGQDMNILTKSILKLFEMKKLFQGTDFIKDLIELISLIYTRGVQCLATGSFHPMFHSEDTYGEWFDNYRTLKKQSLLLNDPEAAGFTESDFFLRLEKAIEEGRNMIKYAKVNKYEKKILMNNVDELILMQCSFLSSQKARESRDAPFSILINGASSVGKSSIVELLFNYFAKLQNLPNEDIYKYTKNPISKFWDGFKSYMWCLLIDDIAFMHPNKAPNGDLSVMEVIQICNNIPYVVDQAAIEDKGKTPLRCKFVIATTNQKNLNADIYFNYPLAVRRRLPLVITVTPKDAYKTDSGFLDTSNLPNDDIPDFWNWKVERVSGLQCEHQESRTRYSEVLKTDSVYEFLQFFGKEVKDFTLKQAQVKNSVNRMKNLTVCSKCYGLNCACDANLQSQVVEDVLVHGITYIYMFFLQYFFAPFVSFLYYWFDNHITTFLYYIVYKLGFGNFQSTTLLFSRVGARTCKSWLTRKQIIIATSVTVIASAVYKAWKYYKQVNEVVNLQSFEIFSDDFGKNVSKAEVGDLSEGSKPKAKENERNNVWFDKSFEITPMQLNIGTSSVNGMDINQFASLIAKNIFKVEIEANSKVLKTHILGLVGQTFLINTHAYQFVQDMCTITVTTGVKNIGIHNTITLNVHKKQFQLYNTDLSYIILGALPFCKDISKYMPKENLHGKHVGFYITPNSDNKILKCKQIQFIEQVSFTQLGQTMDVYKNIVDSPTQVGDCGTPLVIQNGHGYIIAGIHFSGIGNFAYSIPLTFNDSKTILQSIDEMFKFQPGVIKLSYPSKDMKLTDLHIKSPLRFVTDGVAQVYGSFVGFRPKRKSNVTKTFCCDWFVKHGYIINKYPPDLKTWRPWYIGAQAYVNNQFKWNDLIISSCAASFLNDIMSKLTADDLTLVHVLDLHTAINGAPGVAYIDSIKRGTSAGYPYKTSKAKFLELQEDNTVKVDKEILDTCDEIKQCYLRQEKFNPIFCANLKDEPVNEKKHKEGKARVFAGAPFGYSIVVRQYLLPIIRLIQNNKFVFEAGPGTICQSNEWGAILKYLTKDGKYTKFINGDYKEYDKRMYAEFIRWSGWIMTRICEASGYNAQDLLIVNGIFADMIKALMDYNGDLVQFLGSMLSGSPLTVIVNCFVNSLYMRYAFVEITHKHPSEFQNYVNLFTYGDDNVMGVSDNLPEYNHTAIAECFLRYDLIYTMADKDAESVPFVGLKDISFLKRTWVFDKDANAYFAPLDHDSINKMLTICVMSKSVPAEAQCVSAMSSAYREYFFYGKVIFEEKRKLFLQCVQENDLLLWISESTFPTYDILLKEFHEYGTVDEFYLSAVKRNL